MAIYNPFRDRTLRMTFDAVIWCYRTHHKDIWRPSCTTIGNWKVRPGNAWATNFWRGYDGIKIPNWDTYSRRTPAYACWRAGQAVREQKMKEVT